MNKNLVLFSLFGLRPTLSVVVYFIPNRYLIGISEYFAGIISCIPSIGLLGGVSPAPEYTQACALVFFAVTPIGFLVFFALLWKIGHKFAPPRKEKFALLLLLPCMICFLLMAAPNPEGNARSSATALHLLESSPVLFMIVYSMAFSFSEMMLSATCKIVFDLTPFRKNAA